MHYLCCSPLFLVLQAIAVLSKFLCEDLSKHENYGLLANQDCGRSFLHPDENALAIESDEQNISKRILNGTEVEFAEFPWMVQIRVDTKYSENKFRCGGTLINDLYVLTSAHCFKRATKVRVDLGKHYKNSNPDGADKKFYFEIVINAKGIKYYSNWVLDDIALVRLEKRVNFSEYIRPVCLPLSCDLRKRDFVGETTTVAGWGSLEELPTHVPTEVLKKANVTVMRKKYFVRGSPGQEEKIDHDRVISAGTEKNDACRGDSGGPLMYREPTSRRYYEIGIVFDGNACQLNADYDHFGLYIRVTYYMKWILDNIRP